MIDFHTHILPGIDDGSRSVEMTDELLSQEEDAGVTKVVATPHFYADHTSVESFLARRAGAAEKVLEAGLDKKHKLKIFPAAEVYFFQGMGEAELLPKLTVAGTDVLLLEMPFTQWTESMEQEVRNIIKFLQLTVILVHLERFVPLQRDLTVMRRVLDLPLHVQVNTGSVLTGGVLGIGKGRAALKILSSRPGVLLGSDCHSPHSRPVTITAGRERIREKLGREYLDKSDMEAERLLSGAIAAGEMM